MDNAKPAHIRNAIIACVAIIALAAGLKLYISNSGPSPNDAAPSATADQAPSNEIADKKYIEAVHSLILSQGYECPNITNLSILGDSPYGPKLEALCGYGDGSDKVNVVLNYEVYPKHFMVTVCKPWGAWDNGCD